MNRIDEHGKVFTERVRKTRVEVKIVTVHGEAHGYIHLMPDERVKDLLNITGEQFIAVTEVSMRVAGSLERVEADFIALNKNHIVSVIPLDEDRIRRRWEEEYYMPMDGK